MEGNGSDTQEISGLAEWSAYAVPGRMHVGPTDQICKEAPAAARAQSPGRGRTFLFFPAQSAQLGMREPWPALQNSASGFSTLQVRQHLCCASGGRAAIRAARSGADTCPTQ